MTFSLKKLLGHTADFLVRLMYNVSVMLVKDYYFKLKHFVLVGISTYSLFPPTLSPSLVNQSKCKIC